MKKLENKKKIKIVIICISVVILICLLMLLVYKGADKKLEKQIASKQYTSIEDFESIKEIVKYMECEYKKENQSKEKDFSLDIYVKFKVDLYTDGQSNEIFYNRLINLIAEFNHYRSFRLIDDSRKMLISVICDNQNQTIVKKIINGEENYFEKENAKNQLANYKEKNITNLEINSKEINDLIQENWRYAKVDLGNRTSTYQNYDIYFDKGMEVKNISKQVFNIVFTSKYQSPIVNGIKVGTNLEQVEKILGKPAFGSTGDRMLGYKGKDIYVFFYQDQVSIYRVESNYDTTKFLEAISKLEEEKNVNDFLNQMTDIWDDYDSYTKATDFVELRYSLRGVSIIFSQYNSSGVFLYDNYQGMITKDMSAQEYKEKKEELPKYIYINTEKDLVYEQEASRKEQEDSILYDTGYYQDEENEVSGEDLDNQSKYFALVPGNETIGFYSIDKTEAKSEIKASIYNCIWADDLHLVYGVKGKGLYIYNPRTRKNTTLVEGYDNYEIKALKNKVVQYDSKSIQVNY